MKHSTYKNSDEAQSKTALWFLISVAVVAFSLIGLLFYSTRSKSEPESIPQETVAVNISEKQILTLTAKGGYSPSVLNAKSDVPATLVIKTNNTFDCSSAIRIPSLNYKKNLPSRGETKIEIPAQQAGKEITIVCAMGMYSSKILFS